ncbi:MAG: FtsW/RodA/SpoVE family cell cycle protein [Erysipelotrichaceae bacterium]|nr:FtsW/RodA/SpoVE family cell cycle protein [Erysipelotrichaceae bacterium]
MAGKKEKKKFETSFLIMPKDVDFTLLAACVVLTIIGIVFIGSANITSSENVVRNVMLASVKQSVWFVAAFIVMVVMSRIFSVELAKNTAFLWCLIIGGLLGFCLAFDAINDAQAWIHFQFGSVTFTVQPVEFAKAAMILLCACKMCSQPKDKGFWETAGYVFVVFVVYVVIVLCQNDFGSAFVLGLITLGVCMIPHHRSLWDTQVKARVIFVALFAVALFVLLSPSGMKLVEKLPISEYQKARITTSVDPFSDRYGYGFQVSNSLIAFSRGGWFGQGLGSSVQKYGYLPESDSDFILAVIAEESGAVGLVVIFALYVFIAWRLLGYALRVRKEENKVILFGTVLYLSIHFIFNVGGVTAALPLTGVPLLMLSAGGSSLITWYGMLGICESVIARYRRGEE